ncbi:hypothetical protein ABZ553_04825 [Streptomyces sparsogenes]|uniref:hypothetical protein n=1 Tax=Streptomyces sparsogenes TaxID=67365 RepID=UPI0033EFD12B
MVPVQGPDGSRGALELWDLRSGDGSGPGRELRHDGTPYVLLGEHWFALRLTDPGAVLSG